MKEENAPPRAAGFASSPSVLSPGMATLLRGRNGGEPHAVATQPPLLASEPEANGANAIPAVSAEPVPRRRHLQMALALADLLLLVLAARLAWWSSGPLGLLGIALCVVAVATGAWLACLAIWLE